MVCTILIMWVCFVMLSAPSSDCEDISVSSLSLTRRHVPLDTVSADFSLTNDTSSYIGSIVSRYHTLPAISIGDGGKGGDRESICPINSGKIFFRQISCYIRAFC